MDRKNNINRIQYYPYVAGQCRDFLPSETTQSLGDVTLTSKREHIHIVLRGYHNDYVCVSICVTDNQ
jgi:hypothetical protein